MIYLICQQTPDNIDKTSFHEDYTEEGWRGSIKYSTTKKRTEDSRYMKRQEF